MSGMASSEIHHQGLTPDEIARAAILAEVAGLKAEKARQYRVDNRERINARFKIWRQKRRAYLKALEPPKPVRDFLIVATPTKKKQKQRPTRFGIPYDKYDEVLAAQGGCCAICKRDETEDGKRFRIDHDHNTGKTRKLLCIGCNIVLGFVKDDPDRLRAAASYLEAHK